MSTASRPTAPGLYWAVPPRRAVHPKAAVLCEVYWGQRGELLFFAAYPSRRVDVMRVDLETDWQWCLDPVRPPEPFVVAEAGEGPRILQEPAEPAVSV